MKIAIFYKPSIMKVCSFFIIVSFLASTPSMANASFFSDLTDGITSMVLGSEVIANEIPTFESNEIIHNSQNIPLLESSVDPDLKNINKIEDLTIIQDDSFIYSNGFFGSDVFFEKSSLSDQINVYTVKEGDTLSQIAETFGVSTNTIRWENNLSGQTISVGQKLNILPVTGVKHIVKSGDTISKIANKYDAESNDVLIFNDISGSSALKKGDIVFVPNGVIKIIAPKASSPNSSNVSTSTSNTKVQIGYYLRPVSGKITSPYGSRKRGFHPGVDFGNSRGAPVVSSAGGIVLKVVNVCSEGVSRCGSGYGNHIVIKHSNGQSTRYAHLSKTNVSVGQTVSQGEQIGLLGNTGLSTGPHLHFEIENANGSKMRPPF